MLIDLDTLTGGLHDASVCETAAAVALPPSAVRRMCCDADLIPVVLGGAAEVLDVGRSRRLATPAQRRAVTALYASCGFPGCTTPVDRCELHHVTDWLHHHGDTDLANLLPLCIHHHHLVHDGAGR